MCPKGRGGSTPPSRTCDWPRVSDPGASSFPANAGPPGLGGPRPGCVDHLGDTGAVWGALFGVIAHAMTKGERDFSSVMSLRASRYDVSVDADHVAEAERYRAP